jgi:hypothetical protein
MRCAKCGKFNWFYPKFCRKCGAAFPTRTKKHRKLFWTIIGVVVFLIGFFVYIGVTMNRQFKNALAGIQENLVKVTIAKTTGDSVVAGQKMDVTMETLQTDAIAAAQNLAALSVPDDLKPYQAAAILWSIQVASAAANQSDWENLKNQPNDFPLGLIDVDAKNNFEASLKTIDDLKKAGVDAINNKDREAMLKIGAKILVQNHWLKAMLYSENGHLAESFIKPAFAASPSGLQPVPSVTGVDVTCLVCNYPNVYKVHWTDKLRQQYGCEVRCQKKTGEEQTATQEETKYAEALAQYNYDEVPERTLCIAGAPPHGTNGYCIQDAVTSTNEIAASAVGFSDGTKSLTPEQWNYQYGTIELALGTINEMPPEPVDTTGVSPTKSAAGGQTGAAPSKPPAAGGQTGTAPSKPSAEGGHLEGPMGEVKQGEPTVTPEPTEPAEQHQGWDGIYNLSAGNCTCENFSTAPNINDCAKEILSPVEKSLFVYNNVVQVYTGSSSIDSNGHVILHFSGTPTSYTEDVEIQFQLINNIASVAIKYTDFMAGWHNIVCTYTGTRQ